MVTVTTIDAQTSVRYVIPAHARAIKATTRNMRSKVNRMNVSYSVNEFVRVWLRQSWPHYRAARAVRIIFTISRHAGDTLPRLQARQFSLRSLLEIVTAFSLPLGFWTLHREN